MRHFIENQLNLWNQCPTFLSYSDSGKLEAVRETTFILTFTNFGISIQITLIYRFVGVRGRLKRQLRNNWKFQGISESQKKAREL